MSHHPPSDPIPAELFLDLVQEEIEKSRESFPSNEHKLAALQEEVGELAEALIEHDAGSLSFEAVTMEAVQAAAMAVRVGCEGDASFAYSFPQDNQSNEQNPTGD